MDSLARGSPRSDRHSVRARVKGSCSELVEQSRLRPRVFRSAVLELHSMARARTLDENRNQAKQLWIRGNAWGCWPSFTWLTGGRIVYQQVLPAGLACRNDSVFGRLEDAACRFFSLGLPRMDDSHSRDHLQSDHISIAINCIPPCYCRAGVSSDTCLARWQYFDYVELFFGGSGGLQRNQVAHDSYGPCGCLRLSRVAPALGPLCPRRVHGSHCNRHQRDPNHGGGYPGPPFWTRGS